jgi:arylsulfatase A-like enzyme
MDGNYYNYSVTDNGVTKYFKSVYSTDLFAFEATDFIRKAPVDQPFFLMFNPRAPHGPYTPATRHDQAFADREPYRGPSWMEPDVTDKPTWLQRLDPVVDFEVRAYDKEQIDSLESLLAVDEAVAAILKALEETGRLENTLIVFTSDNGYEWGEHRLWGKNMAYDASLRLPLAVRWDGVIPPGTSTSELVANIDFAPTLAAVAGVTPATPVDGVSLTRFFTDPGAELRRQGVVIEHGPGGKLVPPYCGFRTANEVYVRYTTGDEEYYRYPKDPYELENLASRRSAQRSIEALRAKTRTLCSPMPPGMRWR